MKSPLVDALRQAQDDASVEQPQAEEDTAKNQIAMTDAEQGSATDTLGLLDTGTWDSGEADEIAAPELASDEAVREPELFESAIDESAGHEQLSGPAPEFSATNGISIPRVERQSFIATIGRLTPVLCVMAFAASAGGFLVINHLAATDLNDDLDELSARTRVAVSGAGSEPALPQTGISKFETIANRGANHGKRPNDHADRKLAPAGEIAQPNSESRSSRSQSTGPASAHPTVSNSVAKSNVGIREFHDDAYEFNRLGYRAYLDSDYVAAEKHYQEALAIEPNHLDALAGIAATYRRIGRQNQAAIAYEKLLAVNPRNTMAASALLSIRYDDANWNVESELKHLLQRFPSADHLHFALANFYVSQNRWPEAKYEYIAANSLAPENALYNYNVAVSLERTGEQLASRPYYRAALNATDVQTTMDRPAILAHLQELDSRALGQQ